MRSSAGFSYAFILALAVIPFLGMEFPRMIAFYPAVIGLIMLAWYVHGLGKKIKLSREFLLFAGGVSGFALLSCLWSIAPMGAFEKAIIATLIICGNVFLFSLARQISFDDVRPALWLLPAFMAAAAILCSIEIMFDMPLHKFIRASEKKISSAVMNRGIVIYVVMFFPVLALMGGMALEASKKYALYALYWGAGLLMLALTQSQSAQLGFIVAAGAYFLFPHRRQAAYTVLAGAIAAAILMTPLLVRLMFLHGIYGFANLPWLKDGYAGHRLEIWDFVVRYALNSPLYGYGIEATRFVENFTHNYIIHPDPTVLHPHNFAVQIWIEFGAIGATLASAGIALLLYRIAGMDKAVARPALAVFMAALSIAATGYGMWQSWWLGLILCAAALCALTAAQAQKAENVTL